jgi:hypothetical protein
MTYSMLLALLFQSPTSPPLVEVRGVEISGAWLGLAATSYVAVYLRGPEGIRLIYPDSAASWAPRDSGTAAVELPALPSAATSPVNCVITDRDIYRWEVETRASIPIKADDCGPLPPSTTGPGRAIPGRPTQGPGDSWYIPRPNDAADRNRYLIVVAVDADFRPRDPAGAVDQRLRQAPPLYVARAIGEKLGGAWQAVVVPLR